MSFKNDTFVSLKFSLTKMFIFLTCYLFPLKIYSHFPKGSSSIPWYPGVYDGAGGDWSAGAHLSRHIEAPAWDLRTDDGRPPVRLTAAHPTAQGLSSRAQGHDSNGHHMTTRVFWRALSLTLPSVRYRDPGKWFSPQTSRKHPSPSPASNTSLTRGWWKPNATIQVRLWKAKAALLVCVFRSDADVCLCESESGLEVLAVQRVSKAQAWQRAGRAGREDAGLCYRLYTEEEFDNLANMTVPEIQRYCHHILTAGIVLWWYNRQYVTIFLAIHTEHVVAFHLLISVHKHQIEAFGYCVAFPCFSASWQSESTMLVFLNYTYFSKKSLLFFFNSYFLLK